MIALIFSFAGAVIGTLVYQNNCTHKLMMAWRDDWNSLRREARDAMLRALEYEDPLEPSPAFDPIKAFLEKYTHAYRRPKV